MLEPQETVIAVSGWVGPVVAISLVIIAGSFAVIALATGAAARLVAHRLEVLGRTIDSLRSELAPALQAMQQAGTEAQRLAGVVGKEAEDLAESSRRLRLRVHERVANLEAIYDVLEGEIEETALDVAVTLRAFRTRVGWYRWLRRLLGAGRGR
jgi:uncharacterized protein YoxC